MQSVKDTEKLKEAKERVYLKGFYEGVMLVGACAGMKVCDAKPIIKQDMLDKGQVHRNTHVAPLVSIWSTLAQQLPHFVSPSFD